MDIFLKSFFYLNLCFSELLRVIDSLQLTATKKVATPADWEVSLTLQIIHLWTSLHSSTFHFFPLP